VANISEPRCLSITRIGWLSLWSAYIVLESI
jgi:hypothetical protein